MTASAISHRLEGLEPDNLLAFLALLGLLRTLEAHDRSVPEHERLYPRAAWDIDEPPLRPRLVTARPIGRKELTEVVAAALKRISSTHDFEERKDLNYSRQECRRILEADAKTSTRGARARADLLAALMTDAAVKDEKSGIIDPTPFCLLFGQGHQHFLDRLSSVTRQEAPPSRGKAKKAVKLSAGDVIDEALFEGWLRIDPTFSFRWDPEEDIRYALMAGDPTDSVSKGGTQHGANRLAAIGLAELTIVPETRAGRVRRSVVGGESGAKGFSFAWPVWRPPTTLAAIKALLVHPRLREPNGLSHLGVEHVLLTRRISVGKFMNFSRARLI
jgi:hypothetical protein